MGNTISYIGSHGKRLLNRYNAQFRALQFIEKEKLPSAPRHALPPNVQEDPMIYEHLLKKEPSLDRNLKDVYIKSYTEESLVTRQKNPKRPLPVYNGPPKDTFQEPVEMIKGLCTLSQFFEFRSAHENDPVENSATVIARNYSLDVKKVENLLKYYSVFTVHKVEGKEKSSPDEVDDMTFPETVKMLEEEYRQSKERKKKSEDKIEKDSLQLESRQAKN